MNKGEARALALKTRKKEDTSVSSNIVLNHIISSEILEPFNHIGIYYPIGKEIDIIPLVSKYPNKSFYLPITREEISFIPYSTNLVDGPFKTKEPIGSIVNRDLIECFIIPCVAISKDNKRIGYGKGYYDRYLSDYKGYKIGVCYKNASGINVECDDYDVKLDYVLLG